MLGSARALDVVARTLATFVVAGAVVVFVQLQSVAFRLRAREARSRWASNLRDLVNLLAAALLFASFVVAGAPPAAALVFAGTTGVLLEAVRHGGSRPAGRPRASLATGLSVAVPLALFAPEATALLNRLVEALF